MTCTRALLLCVLLGVVSFSVCAEPRDNQPPLSASESDPLTMQWMQGFPPPAALRITQPDSNFFSFPKLRWSVCHMRELLPTARVAQDPRVLRELPVAVRDDLKTLTFKPLNSDQVMG